MLPERADGAGEWRARPRCEEAPAEREQGMSEEGLHGKVPPHNEEAERSLVGALMLDAERIPEIAEELEPEDFYNKRHRMLYEALLGLSSENVPVDFLTVGEALRAQGLFQAVGGNEFLLEVAGAVTSAAHVVYHAGIVRETSVLRRLAREATGILQEAFETRPGGENLRLLLDASEQRIFKLAHGSDKNAPDPLRDVLASALEDITRRAMRRGMTGVPTPFHELNDKLGGLNKGDLLILASRPSMGKTALALNLSEFAAMSNPEWIGHRPRVLFFSLEMNKRQLAIRMLCARARVQIWKLKGGRIPETALSDLQEAVQDLSGARLHIDDTPDMTVMGIRGRSRRLKAKEGLDLVVIDYLQLLHGPKAESRQVEISSISRSLKALARELDVPVLALAQLSRAVDNREEPVPQLSDLRESGSIEQDADVVLLLYRKERYRQFSENPEFKNKAQLIVAKHRNGETGDVDLNFFGEIMRFENPSVETSESVHPYSESLS